MWQWAPRSPRSHNLSLYFLIDLVIQGAEMPTLGQHLTLGPKSTSALEPFPAEAFYSNPAGLRPESTQGNISVNFRSFAYCFPVLSDQYHSASVDLAWSCGDEHKSEDLRPSPPIGGFALCASHLISL